MQKSRIYCPLFCTLPKDPSLVRGQTRSDVLLAATLPFCRLPSAASVQVRNVSCLQNGTKWPKIKGKALSPTVRFTKASHIESLVSILLSYKQQQDENAEIKSSSSIEENRSLPALSQYLLLHIQSHWKSVYANVFSKRGTLQTACSSLLIISNEMRFWY